jgi:MFS family permease
MHTTFRALRHRNYRLFFAGQTISLIGTWMQTLALSWLIYRLTNSPFLLGLISFSNQIPSLALSPFSGVISDRLPRQKLLFLSQTLAMFQAVAVFVLFQTELLRIDSIIILSIAMGLINGLDMPVRQSFVAELVDDPKDLSNAIALNSSMINGTRLIGPSLAGILIAWVGEGPCFLLNALSFVPVLWCISRMRVVEKNKRSTKRFSEDFMEGLRYAGRFMPIASILLLLAALCLFGQPYMIFMPVFARDILHGGPQTQGLLVGAAGFGAFIAALYLASRKSVLGLGRIIAVAAVLFGCGLIAYAHSSLQWLSMLILFFVGCGMILCLASSNTLLQTIAEQSMRGRVMSLYTMAFLGVTPIGSLLAGLASRHIGVQATVTIGGTVCIVAGLIFAAQLTELRDKIRPIYLEKGIIEGIQNTATLTMPPEE